MPCPHGSWQNKSRGIECPGKCTIGTYGAIEGAYNDSNCLECEKGHYGNTTGSAQCRPCPLGTFNNVTGRNDCDDCVPGSSFSG